MEKCSLCGGKIVNHRCVDCGMPYPEKPHYTLRSETAHTHNVNGEEVLHRVRSAAGKDPVYTCDAEDEQDRIDLEGARPHLHAPARPAYQAKPQRRQPQRDRRRGGWLATLIIFGCLCCSTCPSEYFTVWRTWADTAAMRKPKRPKQASMPKPPPWI